MKALEQRGVYTLGLITGRKCHGKLAFSLVELALSLSENPFVHVSLDSS